MNTQASRIREIKPSVMWLTVNRECNFRCKWCYAQGTGYVKEEMPFDLAIRLSRIGVDIGIKQVLLIGGEPTLWPHVTEYNAFAKAEKLQTTLVTNAFLCGSDPYWNKYIENPCNSHGISLKAGNPGQLLELTGVNNFDTLLKGISRLNALSPSFVSIVYGPDYDENIQELVSLAMSCGAKGVSIDFCRGFVSNGSINDSSAGTFRDAALNIVKNYDELNRITDGNLGIEMSMPFCVWPTEFVQKLIEHHQAMSICHVIKRKGLIFDSNGDLLMCNSLFDFPIGRLDVDYCDSKTLLDHLNKPEIIGYYDRISSYPSTKCAECSWYSMCGGGCPLHWATHKPDDVIRPIRDIS